MKASAHHGTVFLALCGMTAFWGSAAWAADAGQTPNSVQDGIHYFSVNPEDGNRDRNYNNDGAVGTDSLAAGTEDTDAVNVAQLKEAMSDARMNTSANWLATASSKVIPMACSRVTR